ncbi:hypothetical protein [Natronogracilivirga saccharolytica]|uniref:Uncharacterized protein n=1 Tax=Natronogracilivirga saccharolytica TaxID=2812953 RepID=A0A8J7SBB4_9BACT|nr:hypothetical protein [Natronogracilivirga saccharolytica]MBP3193928.1 hypothetical protein [Natronogracilivirga saccharolytica]
MIDKLKIRNEYQELKKIFKTIESLYRNINSLEPGVYLISGKVAVMYRYRRHYKTLLYTRGKGMKILVPVFSKKSGISNVLNNALCRANSKSIILFNNIHKSVRRIENEPVYNKKYIELRNKLQEYLYQPKFYVSDDEKQILEKWYYGKTLENIPIRKRIREVEKIINDLLYMNEKEKNNNITGYLSKNDLCEYKAYFKRIGICINEAYTFINRFSLVPSHGDLVTRHVIINDGKYVLIDWDAELVSMRPGWYDIMSPFENDEELKKAWIIGEFDNQIEKTIEIAGVGNKESIRMIMPLAWSISFCRHRPSPSDEVRRRTIKNNLNEWYRIIKDNSHQGFQ